MEKLLHPMPRTNLAPYLQKFATAAIDISDGLSADLNHICTASQVGAALTLDTIPVHPLVVKHQPQDALKFALHGGDDYELCFTVSPHRVAEFKQALSAVQCRCYPIGIIQSKSGLWEKQINGSMDVLDSKGYSHFS